MDRNMPLFCLLLAGALGWSSPGAAETVYRCGDSYSQKPCPGGKAVPVEDTRSEGQRVQTREAAQRDAKVADEMQKARLKEEARSAKTTMPALKAEALQPPERPAANPGVAKKPAYFTAISPTKKDKAPPAKKKKKTKKTAAPAQSS